MKRFHGVLYALILVATSTAIADVFEITPGDGNEIVFESKAPMESFEGRSNHVSGRVTVDLANLLGPVEVEVTMDLASLDTGMGLRNRHMRENHLETSIYPTATFRADTVLAAQPAVLITNSRARITLSGELDLHGVAKPLVCDVDLELTGNGALHIRAIFPVSLADHEIKRPKFLLLKLADTQQVEIDLTAQPVGED